MCHHSPPRTHVASHFEAPRPRVNGESPQGSRATSSIMTLVCFVPRSLICCLSGLDAKGAHSRQITYTTTTTRLHRTPHLAVALNHGARGDSLAAQPLRHGANSAHHRPGPRVIGPQRRVTCRLGGTLRLPAAAVRQPYACCAGDIPGLLMTTIG